MTPVSSATATFTKILGARLSVRYRPNQSVFEQGEAANAVFYLERGRVRLTVVSSRGKEAVIGELARGTFFGEGCLAGQTLRMSTARTIERSAIVRVTRKAMVSLLHREPTFAAHF